MISATRLPEITLDSIWSLIMVSERTERLISKLSKKPVEILAESPVDTHPTAILGIIGIKEDIRPE